jgi:hypothetical protein
MKVSASGLAALAGRVRAEFVEMPGLRLTSRQAARLFALERELCAGLLQHLTDTGFLWQTHDGAFLRRDER